MQLFFRPANLNGVTNTRGSTPLIRAVAAADMEMIKLLLENKADVNLTMADQQTTIIAAIAGRASETQALEIIRMTEGSRCGHQYHRPGQSQSTTAGAARPCTTRPANARKRSSRHSPPMAST